MKADGYIFLHRQIWKNDYLWGDKPFARGQAWIDLLLMVNHENSYVIEFKMTVYRGQRITSIRKLADRWGWSRTKVSDFLNSLQSVGMLKFQCDTKKTVVSIANYDIYQVSEKQKSHRNATEVPPKSTNNNDNKDNIEKKKDKKKEKNFSAQEIIRIVDYLNEKTGKSFKATSKATTSHINARLAEGYTVDDFKTVIDKKVFDWMSDEKMSEYLRPETLFGSKFESYLNAKGNNQQADHKKVFVQTGFDDVGNPTGKWVCT